MAYWNYRVMRFSGGEGTWLAIHEVHYDDDGVPYGCSQPPARVGGDDVGELRLTLTRMTEALDKPILERGDFTGGKS